jgi:hypothetical protein
MNYFFALFGIAVVWLVLDAQNNPAPRPILVMTVSAIIAEPEATNPNNGKNIFYLLSNLQ